MYKCLICKNPVFDEPILIKKDDKWLISGKHTFHYYDTHGIPPEIFQEIANMLIDKAREEYNASHIGATETVSLSSFINKDW